MGLPEHADHVETATQLLTVAAGHMGCPASELELMAPRDEHGECPDMAQGFVQHRGRGSRLGVQDVASMAMESPHGWKTIRHLCGLHHQAGHDSVASSLKSVAATMLGCDHEDCRLLRTYVFATNGMSLYLASWGLFRFTCGGSWYAKSYLQSRSTEDYTTALRVALKC